MAAPKLISYTSTGEDEKKETFYERKEYPPPSPGDADSPGAGVPPPAPSVYLQAGGYSRTSEALDPRYTGPITNPNHLLLFKVFTALVALCVLTGISAVLAIMLAD